MKQAIALALALLVAGCGPMGPAGKPQTLSIHSNASIAVTVRVGTFVPGEASVGDNHLVGETPLNAHGAASIDLPPGKYTLDATAKGSPDHETAVTSIEITAGQGKAVTLVETFNLYKKSTDPADPVVNQRVLAWDD